MPAILVAPESQKIDLADWRSVAKLIDHTMLRPEATRGEVIGLCEEAAHYKFGAVFVHPVNLALAVEALRGTGVKAGVPIGFPFGANLTASKRHEAEMAARLGAEELDMVINVGALKSKERQQVQNDIRAVVEVAHAAGALLKVIIETVLLTVDEKILACELSLGAGADYVKTCTGFNGGGATVSDVALMRGVVGERAGVKAAGGVRTASAVAAMVEAGASRIGTSTGVAILQELGASH